MPKTGQKKRPRKNNRLHGPQRADLLTGVKLACGTNAVNNESYNPTILQSYNLTMNATTDATTGRQVCTERRQGSTGDNANAKSRFTPCPRVKRPFLPPDVARLARRAGLFPPLGKIAKQATVGLCNKKPHAKFSFGLFRLQIVGAEVNDFLKIPCGPRVEDGGNDHHSSRHADEQRVASHPGHYGAMERGAAMDAAADPSAPPLDGRKVASRPAG